MLNENGNGMYMPVAPMGNYYGNGGNDGMMGGGWMWFLLVWMAMFGWGNNGYGNNGTNADIQRGFDQAALTNGITNIQTALCNGFATTNNAISNGFAQSEIAANSRQMADMNQNFALQQSVGNLQYQVATEACADRNAISTALQQVLQASNANTQRLLDTMCQDKIDAKNEKIAELQHQLTMANLASSQNAQTAAILANNEAQTAALEQYLAPVPRPAYVVPSPYTVNMGCGGCGCGAAA